MRDRPIAVACWHIACMRHVAVSVAARHCSLSTPTKKARIPTKKRLCLLFRRTEHAKSTGQPQKSMPPTVSQASWIFSFYRYHQEKKPHGGNLKSTLHEWKARSPHDTTKYSLSRRSSWLWPSSWPRDDYYNCVQTCSLICPGSSQPTHPHLLRLVLGHGNNELDEWPNQDHAPSSPSRNRALSTGIDKLWRWWYLRGRWSRSGLPLHGKERLTRLENACDCVFVF